MYQNVTKGNFTFVDDRKISEEKRKIVPMHIKPGLYPSIVDIVVAISNKTRERLGAQAFEYNGIFVSVFFYLPPAYLVQDQPWGRGDVIHFAAAGPTLRRRMTLGPLQPWPKRDSNAWPSC